MRHGFKPSKAACSGDSHSNSEISLERNQTVKRSLWGAFRGMVKGGGKSKYRSSNSLAEASSGHPSLTNSASESRDTVNASERGEIEETRRNFQEEINSLFQQATQLENSEECKMAVLVYDHICALLLRDVSRPTLVRAEIAGDVQIRKVGVYDKLKSVDDMRNECHSAIELYILCGDATEGYDLTTTQEIAMDRVSNKMGKAYFVLGNIELISGSLPAASDAFERSFDALKSIWIRRKMGLFVNASDKKGTGNQAANALLRNMIELLEIIEEIYYLRGYRKAAIDARAACQRLRVTYFPREELLPGNSPPKSTVRNIFVPKTTANTDAVRKEATEMVTSFVKQLDEAVDAMIDAVVGNAEASVSDDEYTLSTVDERTLSTWLTEINAGEYSTGYTTDYFFSDEESEGLDFSVTELSLSSEVASTKRKRKAGSKDKHPEQTDLREFTHFGPTNQSHISHWRYSLFEDLPQAVSEVTSKDSQG